MDMIPLVDVLASKRNTTKEVHLILFEECNLSCSFCHQDHDSRVGMDKIVSKTRDTIDRLDPTVAYKVNITGGELFHDGVPDAIFVDYVTSVTMILEGLPKAVVYLGTNLIFNPDRLLWVIGELDKRGYSDRFSLSTSYDPAGRFSPSDLRLFLENVYMDGIRERITTVNVVITKQNIDSIMGGKHKETIDDLYGTFDLYFDHFIANDSYQSFQPSEEHIRDFFMYIKEHYPESGPIDGMMSGYDGKLTCQSTIIFTDDNKMVTCWAEAGLDTTRDYEEGLRKKQAAEHDFIEHYGCFSCEFYSRCTMRCFLHHRSLDNHPKECQIKVLYQSLS